VNSDRILPSPGEIDIIELDERLDMALDPLSMSLLPGGTCSNSSCGTGCGFGCTNTTCSG
jgi:hypothetical protein